MRSSETSTSEEEEELAPAPWDPQQMDKMHQGQPLAGAGSTTLVFRQETKKVAEAVVDARATVSILSLARRAAKGVKPAAVEPRRPNL